jgi:hypothetical protein
MSKKSTIPLEEVAADAAKAKAKKPKMSLETLMDTAHQMEQLFQRYGDKLEEAKIIKEQYDKLATETIPEAMQMLKLKDFSLSSGAALELQEIISAKIKEEDKAEAFAWVRENGHGDIIKNEVTVVFGKEEDADAAHLLNYVNSPETELHFSAASREENIHSSTLKAWVSEQIKKPEPFPKELFGVNIFNIAKLTQPKKRKLT